MRKAFDMKLKASWRRQVFFMITLVVILIVAFSLVHRAYEHGPIAAFAVALVISWVPMQLIARVMEQRWLWPPSSQFRSFFWGDLLFLPGTAAFIAFAYQQLPDENYWFQDRTWLLVFAAVGIVAGVVFHRIEEDSYTQARFNSPTKLYHDFVALPVFIYFLLSGAFALYYDYTENGRATITLAALLLFGIWVFFVVTDDQKRGSTAHINYDWLRLHPR